MLDGLVSKFLATGLFAYGGVDRTLEVMTCFDLAKRFLIDFISRNGDSREERAKRNLVYVTDQLLPKEKYNELHDTHIHYQVTAVYINEASILNNSLYYNPPATIPNPIESLFNFTSIAPMTNWFFRLLIHFCCWNCPNEGDAHLFIQGKRAEIQGLCAKLVKLFQKEEAVKLIYCWTAYSLIEYHTRPQAQDGGTCYAHALSQVLHQAMCRVYHRFGGVPKYDSLLNNLIAIYGPQGISTKDLETDLPKWCQRFRLRSKKINEIEARQAVHHNRFVLA